MFMLKRSVLAFLFCLSLFATKNDSQRVYVLAPLIVGEPYSINSPRSVLAWNEFRGQLNELKLAGVTGIEFDVWWGLVNTAPDSYYWAYYDKMINLIIEAGLEPVPIISLHKLGDSVGDKDHQIPMPLYITANNEEALLYRPFNNERNRPSQEINDQAISPWGLNYKDENGSFSIQEAIKDFMLEFRNRYSSKGIKRIMISTGPCGELRYASYTYEHGYPGPGRLMVFTNPAIESFREYAKNTFNRDIYSLNEELGLNLESFDQLYPPTGDNFFRGNHHFSKYGQLFFEWYNDTLVEHGRTLLNMALDVFNLDQHSPFSDGVVIGIKLAGLHWNHNGDYEHRLTELKAGYMVPGKIETYGYEKILKMIKELSVKSEANDKPAMEVAFTAIEMSNSETYTPEGVKVVSKARDLALIILALAKRYDLKISGENALPTYMDLDFWKNMTSALDLGYYQATLLRMDDFKDPTNMENLKKFVKDVIKLTPTIEEAIKMVRSDRDITELNEKFPFLFSEDNINEQLVEKAKAEPRESIALQYLSWAEKIVTILNDDKYNILERHIAVTRNNIYLENADILVTRICEFLDINKNDYRTSEEKGELILKFSDFFIKNGEQIDPPTEIILGTAENNYLDGLTIQLEKMEYKRHDPNRNINTSKFHIALFLNDKLTTPNIRNMFKNLDEAFIRSIKETVMESNIPKAINKFNKVISGR